MESLPALYLRTQSEQARRTARESLYRAALLLGHAEPALVPWESLDLRALNTLRDRLAQKYAPATGQLTLCALRGVYRVGLLAHRTTAEQCEIVRSLRVRGSRVQAGRSLSEEEVGQLLTTAKKTLDEKGPIARAVFAAMVGTGMRCAEPCALRAGAVTGDGLRIIGKGNKERIAPLDPFTRRELDTWLVERKRLAPRHAFLFSFHGRPLRVRVVTWLFLWLEREAAVEHFSPHDVRRTFATRLFDLGLGLRDVQLLMGHAAIATTERYDKRKQEKIAKRRLAVTLFPGVR